MTLDKCNSYHKWQLSIIITLLLFILGSVGAGMVNQNSKDNTQDNRITRLETQTLSVEKSLEKIDKKLDFLIEAKYGGKFSQ
jgi:hypothetical protein